MENQSEAPAVSEAQLAARIAAMKTLQPGDIIVSDAGGEQTYIGIVSGSSGFGGAVLDLAVQVRISGGKAKTVEFDAFTCIENCANWPGLRIHRTTEGVL